MKKKLHSYPYSHMTNRRGQGRRSKKKGEKKERRGTGARRLYFVGPLAENSSRPCQLALGVNKEKEKKKEKKKKPSIFSRPSIPKSTRVGGGEKGRKESIVTSARSPETN